MTESTRGRATAGHSDAHGDARQVSSNQRDTHAPQRPPPPGGCVRVRAATCHVPTLTLPRADRAHAAR